MEKKHLSKHLGHAGKFLRLNILAGQKQMTEEVRGIIKRRRENNIKSVTANAFNAP